MAGWGSGPLPHEFVRNRQSFGNFDASSEIFRTFAVDEKDFELCRKIFELAPLLYRCHDAPFDQAKIPQLENVYCQFT